MVNIPGVLANGGLAGVPPVYGVYTMIAGAVDLDPMGRLGLNISNILSFIGTLGIGAIVLLIVGSLVIGMLLGGRDPSIRSAMGLSTANRNGAAVLLVATQNFSGTNTLPFVLVGVVLMLLILLPFARRLGARSEAAAASGT
jgi:hypothetical protein